MLNPLPEDPFEFFTIWYNEALASDIKEPTSMILSTSTKEGRPSSRVLLLKHYDARGFAFFTNLTSRKGRELAENTQVAMLFYWMQLERQVRLEGIVERVTEKEADDYFMQRPRESQIGAWASKQSMVMEHEQAFLLRVQEITKQFEGGPIPRPPFWSGFRLVPDSFEFWKEGSHRMHQRVLYTRIAANHWQIDQLYP